MRGLGGRRRRTDGARAMHATRQPTSSGRSAQAALPPTLGHVAERRDRPASGSERTRRTGRSDGPSRFTVLRGLRRPRVSRGLFSPLRAGAFLAMLACGYAFTFVTGPTAFAVSRTELPALTWTDEAVVQTALGLPPGTNVFELDPAPLEARLLALPSVADAHVSVTLPDAAVVVRITERQPILAWTAGGKRYLVDREGVILAAQASDQQAPDGVAVVEDRRLGTAGALVVGDHLDPVDLDVATRLGSLLPSDVGSLAPRLRVAITDDDGFTVAAPDGWTAVFGFYSPATRPTDMLPGQVRLLRTLIAGREGTVSRVVLASETDGTYVPTTIPKPTPR